MDKKTTDKLKEGVSVQEIENFGKKYRLELFFCIIFILATFFSRFLYGLGWSVFLAGIGGIIGIWIPKKIERATIGCFRFLRRQKSMTRWILAGVCFVLSVFLPPLVFAIIGLVAGHALHHNAMKSAPIHEDTHPE
ncbi:MAG: hypothetical protein P0S94_04910 [Simkaniaceae bacterium]|nr:hypothetical protein [Simkaniaceae bacterium]